VLTSPNPPLVRLQDLKRACEASQKAHKQTAEAAPSFRSSRHHAEAGRQSKNSDRFAAKMRGGCGKPRACFRGRFAVWL